MSKKVPTRSPTHEEVELSRLPGLGLELEELARDDEVALGALVELAEDRGRPASHYLAAIPLATELRVATGGAGVIARVCAGTCQRYGALDVLDHLVGRAARGGLAIAPVECLDRCDEGPAVELHGAHGALVLAPATIAALDEALGQLVGG
jgi:NADH:ubiquinone oxidoreductase subunit E